MSVVERKMVNNDDGLFLLTKSADNVIFERMKPGGPQLPDSWLNLQAKDSGHSRSRAKSFLVSFCGARQ
jgi:hypothetical protein